CGSDAWSSIWLPRADKTLLGGGAAALDHIDHFDVENAESDFGLAEFVLDGRPSDGGHVAGISAGPNRDPDQDAVDCTLDKLVLPQARYPVQGSPKAPGVQPQLPAVWGE